MNVLHPIERGVSLRGPLASNAADRDRTFARAHAGAFAALLGLAVVPFAPALFAPFFADDYFHVEAAARLPDSLWRGWILPLDSAGAWWTPPGLAVEYFRPLVVLSFAVDRLMYGMNAAGYHLTNLLMHAASTFLVWAIARHILGSRFRACASAALFAVHPCHVQSIAWISGRTDVLASMLYAGAFLLYLQGRSAGRGSGPRLVLSMLLFALALLAKEMAITLPIVILSDTLLRPDPQRRLRRFLPAAVAATLAALYVAVRVAALGPLHAPPFPFAYHLASPGLVRHLVTAPLLYLADLTLFVPPDPMVSVPFWTRHPAGLAVLAGVACLALWDTLRRTADRRIGAWGVVFLAATLLPVWTLTVGEHFLYLPSMGYCILLGAKLDGGASALASARVRLLRFATVGVVLAISLGRTFLFDGVAYASSRAIDDAKDLLDRAPRANELLVADLPWAAALAFPHALRMARPDRRVDVAILSIGPSFFGGPDRSSIAFPAQDRIELRRPRGFLGSYFERALAGQRPAFRPGDQIERPGYTVTVLDASSDQLRAFSVRLRDPARTLVMGGAGSGLEWLAAESNVPRGSPICGIPR
jgi:hypothetical protein